MRLHALVLVSIRSTLWPGHIGRQVGAAAQLGTAQRNLGFIVNGGGLQPDSGFGLRGQLLGKGCVFQDIRECLLYRLRFAVVHEFLFRRYISKKVAHVSSTAAPTGHIQNAWRANPRDESTGRSARHRPNAANLCRRCRFATTAPTDLRYRARPWSGHL